MTSCGEKININTYICTVHVCILSKHVESYHKLRHPYERHSHLGALYEPFDVWIT